VTNCQNGRRLPKKRVKYKRRLRTGADITFRITQQKIIIIKNKINKIKELSISLTNGIQRCRNFQIMNIRDTALMDQLDKDINIKVTVLGSMSTFDIDFRFALCNLRSIFDFGFDYFESQIFVFFLPVSNINFVSWRNWQVESSSPVCHQ
jgi:hypothetical protein